MDGGAFAANQSESQRGRRRWLPRVLLLLVLAAVALVWAAARAHALPAPTLPTPPLDVAAPAASAPDGVAAPTLDAVPPGAGVVDPPAGVGGLPEPAAAAPGDLVTPVSDAAGGLVEPAVARVNGATGPVTDVVDTVVAPAVGALADVAPPLAALADVAPPVAATARPVDVPRLLALDAGSGSRPPGSSSGRHDAASPTGAGGPPPPTGGLLRAVSLSFGASRVVSAAGLAVRAATEVLAADAESRPGGWPAPWVPRSPFSSIAALAATLDSSPHGGWSLMLAAAFLAAWIAPALARGGRLGLSGADRPRLAVPLLLDHPG